MSLEIRERESEGVTILDLAGRLTVGEPCAQLRDKVKGLITKEGPGLIMNLGGVDYIDSSGLGTMVICFTTVQKAGKKLKLLNLSRRSIELLVLTKLETVFETYDSEQDAVNSFFPGREVRRFDILNFVQQQEQKAK